MKKSLAAGVLVVVVVLLAVVPQSEAWGHGRVFIGVGPGWWGAPNPWWYYPPYYYPPPPPQTVVVQPAPVYVERTPPPAPPAPPEPSRTAYWYYCPSTHAYYPNVPTCSDAWVQVPPRGE
jgi:hypothetical protein